MHLCVCVAVNTVYRNIVASLFLDRPMSLEQSCIIQRVSNQLHRTPSHRNVDLAGFTH